ncbi:MAG: GTP 3',8-cyclase MoaA [Deltaproteobacteria bacterium]|nr:GTP 3',8-cyclase MoaA [Deltaproteobacteria bacterium]
MLDSYGRNINYARISITGRCNLRCIYCYGPDAMDPGPPMDFDDILRLVRILAQLGITKLKITGGEPTLRPDLVKIVKAFKDTPGISNVTLTTNGLLLEDLARPLAEAGLNSVNISIDSLDPEKYCYLCGSDSLSKVLNGLKAAYLSSLPSIKVNCVPQVQTQNEDLLALADIARHHEIHIRFIELMPIGPGASLERPISNKDLLKLFEDNLGELIPTSLSYGNGPASYYQVKGFKGLIGFIAAMGSCFCARCNRIRVTSDGFLKTCLHMDQGLLLPLKDEKALKQVITEAIKQKPKSHLFNSSTISPDLRTMNRIGG